MRNKVWFLFTLGFVTLSMTTAFAAGDPTMQRGQSPGHQSGTIDKLTDDKITVKTEDGKTRSFTINEAQREELKSLKQGDHVDFTLDKQNQIVGFNKGGSSPDSRDPNRLESNPNMNPNSNTNPNSNPNMDSGSSPNSNPNTTPSPNSPNPNTNPNSTPAPSPSPMR